jgi:hypothetical protein
MKKSIIEENFEKLKIGKFEKKKKIESEEQLIVRLFTTLETEREKAFYIDSIKDENTIRFKTIYEQTIITRHQLIRTYENEINILKKDIVTLEGKFSDLFIPPGTTKTPGKRELEKIKKFKKKKIVIEEKK